MAITNQVSDYLKDASGWNAIQWLNYMGRTVEQYSKPIRGHKLLKTTASGRWLANLANKVNRLCKPRMNKSVDENIYTSRVLSVILTLWVARIIKAKCYDPRRPIKQRQEGLERLTKYNQIILTCLTDESLDHILFSKQEWNSPFGTQAKYTPDEIELARQKFGKSKRS